MAARTGTCSYARLALFLPSLLVSLMLSSSTAARFHLQQGGTSSTSAGAASTDDDGQCGPKQVHLTVGKDPSASMMVSFSSSSSSSSECPGGGGVGGGARKAVVLVGTDPSSLNATFVETGPAWQYNYTAPGASSVAVGDGRYEDYTSPSSSSSSAEEKGENPLHHHHHHHHDHPHVRHPPYTSDYLHHIEVTGLEPNTTYYYQCAIVVQVQNDEDHAHASKKKRRRANNNNKRGDQHQQPSPVSPVLRVVRGNVSTFLTAPPPGDGLGTGSNLRFAIVGDMGMSHAARSNLNHMTSYHKRHGFSSILLVGDVSYANSNQTVWDDWFDMMEPLASRVPLQTAPGNHEIEVDGDTHDIFVPYDHRFVMPSLIPGHKEPNPKAGITGGKDLVYDHGNAYYSYTYGPAHFVILSSFSITKTGSAQYRWLASELETVDRTVTPWLFVACHAPMYNTFGAHANGRAGPGMKESMEHLLVEHRVNAVFSGHVHAYMRSHPVVHDAVDPRGPVHVIIGDGGAGDHNVPFRSKTPEEWVAKRDGAIHGFGAVKVVNGTHAHWTWVRNLDEKVSTVHDSAYIYNQLYV